MNLNDINIFVKVVEAGSFASASKLMGMPSTTVSRKVQLLEESLGVKLLYRSTRKLSLTQEGSHYFQLCQQHLMAIEEANELIMQARVEPKGKIKITSPLDFAIEYVYPWIELFQKGHPHIQVELDTSDNYVNLIENRIDIAFRSGELKDSSLIARRIGPKESICCASPEFLQTAEPLKHPDDLTHYQCVVKGGSFHNNTWRFIENNKTIDVPVNGSFISNSMHLVIKSILAGTGIGYVPVSLVKAYLDNGKLVQVLKDFQTPESSMYIIYQSKRYQAAPTRLFIDFVINKTQPVSPWSL